MMSQICQYDYEVDSSATESEVTFCRYFQVPKDSVAPKVLSRNIFYHSSALRDFVPKRFCALDQPLVLVLGGVLDSKRVCSLFQASLIFIAELQAIILALMLLLFIRVLILLISMIHKGLFWP